MRLTRFHIGTGIVLKSKQLQCCTHGKESNGAKATVKCLYDVLVVAKCTLAAEKVFGILKVTENESPRGSGLDMGTYSRESVEPIVAYA